MATGENSPWFPLFEFQNYIYQSFLIVPTAEEKAAPAGVAVTAKKWSKGAFVCGQAFSVGDGYTLSGFLRFDKGNEFTVEVKGTNGLGDSPATFEATATGTAGVVKGTISELVGWVFPENPISTGAGRVKSIQGSIRAVRGSDIDPTQDPGGVPLGTVGAFMVVVSGS